MALDYGTRVEPEDEASEGEDESIASRRIGRRIREKDEQRSVRSGDPGIDGEAESDKEDDIPPVSLFWLNEIDIILFIQKHDIVNIHDPYYAYQISCYM